MTKFLTYAFLFMVLMAGCSAAFADNSVVTDTTVFTTNAPVATDPAIADPMVPDTSTSNTVSVNGGKSGSTITSSDDIDCDQAEELYDSGELTDDVADYCDYGPDGEWDTSDDYDSWES